MQAVILAAGKGERLHPLTLKRSKAMMPVVGKPMVERVMDTLAAAGLRDFTLVMGEADADLAQHFEGRSVRLARQPQPLGAANALQCAAPFITDDFVLSACDNLVSSEDVIRLLEAWQAAPRSHAILTLMPMEPGQLSRSGVVALAPSARFRREAARGSAGVEGEWVTRIVEKPGAGLALSNLASLPLYCFSPRFLSYLADVQPSPRGEYELQDAIQRLIEREGRVRGLPVPSRLTLTDAADLLAINRHYLGVEPSLVEPDAVGANTRLIPPLRVEPGVSIGAGCQIGPNVYLEGNCQIGDGVKLRDVVALRGTTIAGGASLADQVLG